MKTRRVQTTYGWIEGEQKGEYTVYRGIPYAKPPVGELRFCAPQRPEPWEGVRQATAFSNRFMQDEHDDMWVKEFYSNPDYMPSVNEDALYLNIWTPTDAEGKRLPVAFYVHGGGFDKGFGSELEFDGAAYCARQVILVTINYRLGVFGFLAHPWMREEDPHHSTGNYGILDQITALEWVYENIAVFGGDPGNITVFGQSAGAMSVQTLLSSELTRGKIARAILMSGGGYRNPLSRDVSLEEAYEVGRQVAAVSGVGSLEELRKLPAEALLAAGRIVKEDYVAQRRGLPYVPVIDGHVLKDGYDRLIEQGRVQHVPCILGSTKNDLGVTDQMLANGDRGELYEGCIRYCRQEQKWGNPDCYAYYFARELPGDGAGAYHSAELWYIFGTLGRCWRPFIEADYHLSEQILACWTNFMKNGNPNGEGLSEWKPCEGENPFVMEWNV